MSKNELTNGKIGFRARVLIYGSKIGEDERGGALVVFWICLKAVKRATDAGLGHGPPAQRLSIDLGFSLNMIFFFFVYL